MLRDQGLVVIEGQVTLRVGKKNEIRYPDLTVQMEDGSWEFIEVKSGKALSSKRQIRLDKVIQTEGVIVTRAPFAFREDLIGPKGPMNVHLYRMTYILNN